MIVKYHAKKKEKGLQCSQIEEKLKRRSMKNSIFIFESKDTDLYFSS